MIAFILLQEWEKLYRLCAIGTMEPVKWLSVVAFDKTVGPADPPSLFRETWHAIKETKSEFGYHPDFTEFFDDLVSAHRVPGLISFATKDKRLSTEDGCLTPQRVLQAEQQHQTFFNLLEPNYNLRAGELARK